MYFLKTIKKNITSYFLYNSNIRFITVNLLHSFHYINFRFIEHVRIICHLIKTFKINIGVITCLHNRIHFRMGSVLPALLLITCPSCAICSSADFNVSDVYIFIYIGRKHISKNL